MDYFSKIYYVKLVFGFYWELLLIIYQKYITRFKSLPNTLNYKKQNKKMT